MDQNAMENPNRQDQVEVTRTSATNGGMIYNVTSGNFNPPLKVLEVA